jgi:two-component system, OmpR family, heavy metal sensor histidine kinase CusS
VISSCLDECSHLSVTVDRLLFLARADGYHNDLCIVKLCVATEVEDVVDYFYDTAKAAGVELTSSCASVHIHADQPLFRRALSNLITNALAHTPAGGSISVTAAQGAAGVTVTVTDTGCGVAPEHLPRLFDRFYQVERETGKESVGSGLGLAIVKAIMTMHGGSVALESTPGQGTTATLQFTCSVGACDAA